MALFLLIGIKFIDIVKNHGMIIGLILLALTVILMFFGIAKKVFNSFGITYWLAFIMVGVLIGCAFIPSFKLFGASVNVAGFIAPVVFGIIFFVLARRSHEVWRAAVTAVSVTALYVSVILLVQPISDNVVTAITAGFLCGAVAYLVAKTRVAALAGVFVGVPLGDVIASAVNVYVSGSAMSFGSAASFDAAVLAGVFAIILYEAIAAIKRTMNARARRAVEAETAQEFDPDEYKRYFDE